MTAFRIPKKVKATLVHSVDKKNNYRWVIKNTGDCDLFIKKETKDRWIISDKKVLEHRRGRTRYGKLDRWRQERQTALPEPKGL